MLIGSVSLGLIQLIVIGLEIVDSIDWLAAGGSALVAANDHNPSSPDTGSSSSSGGQANYLRQIYLPLLQFGFVSLLMQFILARVSWPICLCCSPPFDRLTYQSAGREAANYGNGNNVSCGC